MNDRDGWIEKEPRNYVLSERLDDDDDDDDDVDDDICVYVRMCEVS